METWRDWELCSSSTLFSVSRKTLSVSVSPQSLAWAQMQPSYTTGQISLIKLRFLSRNKSCCMIHFKSWNVSDLFLRPTEPWRWMRFTWSTLELSTCKCLPLTQLCWSNSRHLSVVISVTHDNVLWFLCIKPNLSAETEQQMWRVPCTSGLLLLMKRSRLLNPY